MALGGARAGRVRHWRVFEADNLTPSAVMRRLVLRAFLDNLDALESRFEAKRAATLEREAARAP
jgi:hypothetical protein